MTTSKKAPPFLRTAYNYDTNQASAQSALRCEDKSLTKQSFAEESDINTIVRRFHITGELPQNVRLPTYQDFEQVFDFHSAMNAIAQAKESFDKMPAEIRAKFHNDPAEFVDFCSKDENHKEAATMGLLTPQALQQLQDQQRLANAPTGSVPLASGPSSGESPEPPATPARTPAKKTEPK